MDNKEKIELVRTSPNPFKLTLKAGKELEPEFTIPVDEMQYYGDLFLYFAKSNKSAFDLNKGLLISGDIGTGKTLSMKIMQNLFKGFQIINTRYIVREYIQEGVAVINTYGRDSFLKTPTGNNDYLRPAIKCFDDFGLENVNAKMFGNQQNVMEEIILDRYDMFLAYGMKTFATTNLNVDSIEQTYGERVKDRLREMMNYVTLTGKTKRK